MGTTDQEQFITVVGDSHVRSFSYNPLFLPLFIGPGKSICFVTERTTEEVRTRLRTVFSRIDPERQVLLVFGEPDVRMHLQNRFGTRSGADSDSEVLRQFVSRYMATVDSIRSEFPHDIVIYCSVPTLRDNHNVLAREYNTYLDQACRERGLPYIDIWDGVVTNQITLDGRYAAEHIHLNESITPLVVERLIDAGCLPGTVDKDDTYAWEFNHTLTDIGQFDVRVWGDAELDPNSPRFVRTRAYSTASDIVRDALTGLEIQFLGILPSTEGFIPLRLPPRSYDEALLFEPDPKTSRAVHRLISFSGRDEISVTNEFPDLEGVNATDGERAVVGVLNGSGFDEQISEAVQSFSTQVSILIDDRRGATTPDRTGNHGFQTFHRVPYAGGSSSEKELNITVTFQRRTQRTLFQLRRTRARALSLLERTAKALYDYLTSILPG